MVFAAPAPKWGAKAKAKKHLRIWDGAKAKAKASASHEPRVPKSCSFQPEPEPAMDPPPEPVEPVPAIAVPAARAPVCPSYWRGLVTAPGLCRNYECQTDQCICPVHMRPKIDGIVLARLAKTNLPCLCADQCPFVECDFARSLRRVHMHSVPDRCLRVPLGMVSEGCNWPYGLRNFDGRDMGCHVYYTDDTCCRKPSFNFTAP